MGMALSLKRLTNASRERILADPKEISLCFDLPERVPFSFGDFFRKLFGKKTEKADSDDTFPEHDPFFDEPECDLDKSWDVLCFLFCGATWGSGAEEKSFPSNFLLAGRGAVDLSDLYGYGPPWAYSSQEVKEIAVFLDAQTEEELRTKFSPDTMKEAEPYPSVWNNYKDSDSPGWEEEWEYFFGFFPDLKKFVRETADRDLALLLYLS